FSPDGKWLAAGGWHRRIRLWDPVTGKEVRIIDGPKPGVGALAFSANGKLLAGAGLDRGLYLWDPETGQDMGRLERFPGDLKAVAFAPKGNMLVTGDIESVRLWDVAERKLLHILEAEKAFVSSVAFAPDGLAVAAACGDSTARVWDTSGKPLHRLK